MRLLTYARDILLALHVMKAAPSSLPPHVFAVADKAYSTLLRTHKSQVSPTATRDCFCMHAAAVLWPTPLWICPTNCTQIPSYTLARCRRCVLCRGKVARERPRRQSCLYGTFSRGVSTEVVVLLAPVEGMATLCTKRFVSSLSSLALCRRLSRHRAGQQLLT